MKQNNRWAISAGLVALLGIAVSVVSCSDDKKGATGVGGAAATGGSASDTGGATSAQGGTTSAQGGSTSATGGNTSTSTHATGGGGNPDSGTTTGCTADNTNLAPTDGLIADFVGTGPDAGIEIVGGLTTYGGDAAPDAEITDGALHITIDQAQGDAAQYVGTVVFFDECVDATSFKGVQFTISGTMSAGCTMQYSTNHSAADDVTSDPKGSCTLGAGKCYSPQKAVTISDTDTDVQVAWTGGLNAGNPNVPVDPAQLVSVQWQFTIAKGTGSCVADITVKNVKFYN